ncbi:MAG: hypothetical protein HYS04_08635 [Acidobacteria bacterium]|nr:hypothetical protein [Acidobacteriota bacterium]
MFSLTLDDWARGGSFLHRRDARAKLLAALLILVLLATCPPRALAGFTVLLLAGVAAAGLPFTGVLVRASAVLPFALTFTVMNAVSGDPSRAFAMLAKSYLSAVAVVTLAGATAMPELMHAARRLGAPPALTAVAHFLYRYLFVIAEQAARMRLAAESRAAARRSRPARFRAAAGLVGVLFARAHLRAAHIHNAMLARCFTGEFRRLAQPCFRASDAVFLLAVAVAGALARFAPAF